MKMLIKIDVAIQVLVYPALHPFRGEVAKDHNSQVSHALHTLPNM